MRGYDFKGFYLPDLLKECNELPTLTEQIDYLETALEEWEINPPELDLNGEIDPPFEKRLQIEINRRKRKLEKFKKVPPTKEDRTIDDLIWWKGTEPMLIYLIDLLFAANLIDSTLYEKRFAIMAKHFLKPNRENYDNRQMARVYEKMREEGIYRKPKESDAIKIEEIIREIRKMMSSEI